MFRSFLSTSRGLTRSTTGAKHVLKAQVNACQFLHSSPSRQAEKDKLPPTILEKYNLYDPTRWVPITVGTFAFATATGIYHWDAESQMLGLFAVFVATIYSQGGAAIGKFFDDEREAMLAQHREIEDKDINLLKAQIAEIQKFTKIDAEVKAYAEAQKALKGEMIAAAPKRFEQRKAEFFLNKLQKITNYEAEMKESFSKTLIDRATAEATKKFQQDEVLQRKSMSAALNWLQSPGDKKAEMKEVGDLFRQYFVALKNDPTATADIEAKIKVDLDKIVNGEKFEVRDEFQVLEMSK